MTEYSQIYWNKLIEQYREGVISDQDRYQLEKQALDDPFLFDALEGFTLYDNSEKEIKPEKNRSKIFTLPRIAAAASIIFLVTTMIILKNQSDSQLESDNTIAMVIEDDAQEVNSNVEKKLEVSTSHNSPTATPNVKESEKVNSDSPSNLSVGQPTPNGNTGANDRIETDEFTFSDEVITKSKIENGDNEKELVEEIQFDKDETVEGGTETEDSDVMAEAPISKRQSKEIVESGNATKLEAIDVNDEIEIIAVTSDLNLLEEEIRSKKKSSPNLLYYEAVPVIGKEIFDDYAKERIDERGLRQEKPQKVTIEFTIDANGNLTDFHHIFNGCSECGSYAISILTNSGVWKTVPPGFSGKARYTFIF